MIALPDRASRHPIQYRLIDASNSTPSQGNSNTANSTPPSDKPPTLKDLPTVLSGIAVLFTVLVSLGTGFVFLLSCLYLVSLEKAFGIRLSDYVEFSDYVNSLPTLIATVGVIIGLIMLILYGFVVFGGLKAISFLLVHFRVIPEKCTKRQTGVAARAMFAPVSITSILTLLCLAVIHAYTVKGNLPSMPVSEVFTKDDRTRIEGRLFRHSGKYIFLWSKGDRIIVVPIVEVERIETSSSLSLVASTPTPVMVPPEKRITPSEMSPTSK